MNRGLGGFRSHFIVFSVFAIATFAWLFYILREAGTIGGGGYTLTVEAPTSIALAPGARVTAAGTEVGSILSVERADELQGHVEIAFNIFDDEVSPLPVDSQFQIRTRSQVGEIFVSVDVGDSTETIPDGGAIPFEQVDDVVEVDQILSVLRGKTRERTRTLFSRFGDAIAGRGDELNRTFAGTNRLVPAGTDLFQILHDDRQNVARLVDQLGRVTAAVGERGAAIDTLARDGVGALQAIASRDTSLEELLAELPATLDSVRDASLVVGDVSDRATPVVNNLAIATRDLEPVFRDLVPAARAGRRLLASLERAAPAANTLAVSITRAHRLPEVVEPLTRSLCQVNPTLRYVRPHAEGISLILGHLGSASDSYDRTGHLIRLQPILNERSISGAPPAVAAAADLMQTSGLFGISKQIDYSPYMNPGDVGKFTSVPNGNTNKVDLRNSGYVYPRVRADC